MSQKISLNCLPNKRKKLSKKLKIDGKIDEYLDFLLERILKIK